MFSKRAHVFNDSSSEVRGNFFSIYGVLIAINILAWVWAIAAFRHHPVSLGSALLPSNLEDSRGVVDEKCTCELSDSSCASRYHLV